MKVENNNFRLYLKENNLRLTTNRQVIMEAIFSLDQHFEVEDLLQVIRAKNKKISRATVYRTLSLLLKNNLIKQLYFDDKRSFYEKVPSNEHHDHLSCKGCGKVIEVFSPALESIQEEICLQYGFKPTYHRLTIFGMCLECSSVE